MNCRQETVVALSGPGEVRSPHLALGFRGCMEEVNVGSDSSSFLV